MSSLDGLSIESYTYRPSLVRGSIACLLSTVLLAFVPRLSHYTYGVPPIYLSRCPSIAGMARSSRNNGLLHFFDIEHILCSLHSDEFLLHWLACPLGVLYVNQVFRTVYFVMANAANAPSSSAQVGTLVFLHRTISS